MIPYNELLLPATSAAVNITSNPFQIEQHYGYSVQVVAVGGTLVGTLHLEGSDDVGAVNPDGSVSGLTNWTTVLDSSEPVTGDGTVMYNVTAALYKWGRLVYTATSGTGTISARVNAKGQ